MERIGRIGLLCLAGLMLCSVGAGQRKGSSKTKPSRFAPAISVAAASSRLAYCIERYAGFRDILVKAENPFAVGPDRQTVTYRGATVGQTWSYEATSRIEETGAHAFQLEWYDRQIRPREIELAGVPRTESGLGRYLRLSREIDVLRLKRAVVESNTPWSATRTSIAFPWASVARITFKRFDENARSEEHLAALGSINITFARPLVCRLASSSGNSKIEERMVEGKLTWVMADPVSDSKESSVESVKYVFDTNGRLNETVKALRDMMAALKLKVKVVEVLRGL